MQEKYGCLYRLGEAQCERLVEDQVLIFTRCQQILVDRLWLPDRFMTVGGTIGSLSMMVTPSRV